MRPGRSRAQQGRGHDGDVVLVAVGVAAGGDHDGVGEALAQALAQPQQVAGVPRVRRGGGLDLDGDDAAVAVLDDEVDLVLAALGAQVVDGSIAQRGVDLNTYRFSVRLHVLPARHSGNLWQ